MSDASTASQQELWSDGGTDDPVQAQGAAQPVSSDKTRRDVGDATHHLAVRSLRSRADDHEANLDSGAEDEQVVGLRESKRPSQVTTSVTPCADDDTSDERTTRTRGSALWAAYGDALGFVSELVDQKGLERRTRGAPLDHLMEWKRRIGGRRGVEVSLPAGCWSDDTQLRMAVSRSISSHGFDVETFGRVELPVWLSYALGGGRASKAAAKNLGKPSTLWYANTFAGWANAGGNGAAMRIHPHVWASRDLDGDYMLDVIADSVCTHGHPRAIVGACFHAATLAHCVKTGAVPDSDTCAGIADRVGDAVQLIERHSTLGPVWSGLWERETGERVNDVWWVTVGELHHAIKNAADGAEATNSDAAAYHGIVDRLGLRDRAQQGSGILTTVAAVALASAASGAHEGVVAAANAIGTDTDTIASMAGALLGACDATADPPEESLDSAYLRAEADRLVAISQGEQVHGHPYPDILTWSAPQTQADALVSDNGSLAVEGLGQVTRLGTDLMYTPREDFAWEWVRTNFGQTLLMKRRPTLRTLGVGSEVTPPLVQREKPDRGTAESETSGSDRFEPKPLDRGVKVDDAIEYAKGKIADDKAIGYTVRRVARDGTYADLAVLVAALRDDLRR